MLLWHSMHEVCTCSPVKGKPVAEWSNFTLPAAASPDFHETVEWQAAHEIAWLNPWTRFAAGSAPAIEFVTPEGVRRSCGLA